MSKTPEWAKAMNGTIKKYVKQDCASVAMRNQKLMALLEKHGGITYDPTLGEVACLAKYLIEQGREDLASLVMLQNDIEVSLAQNWVTEPMRRAVGRMSFNIYGRK